MAKVGMKAMKGAKDIKRLALKTRIDRLESIVLELQARLSDVEQTIRGENDPLCPTQSDTLEVTSAPTK